jgi:hypothetical protein
LIPGRAATVSGFAFDSRGRPLQNVGLTNETRGPGLGAFFSAGNSVVNADGSFTIKNVPPGEYKVMARASGEKGTETAAFPIVVNGVDIANVSVGTSAGGSISGQVVTETGSVPDLPRDRMRVTARVANGDFDPRVGGGSPDSGRVKDDWTFAVTDIYGPVHLRVNMPDGWMVKSILRDDQEVGESAIDLRSGEEMSGVRIVVSTSVTTVTGQLVDDKGVVLTDGTVIVFASDGQKWATDSRFVRPSRPDQQGQYQIKGLPAGEYLAVAVDYVPDGMWNDPEYLESLRRYAQRFTLRDGDARTLSLKLVAVE